MGVNTLRPRICSLGGSGLSPPAGLPRLRSMNALKASPMLRLFALCLFAGLALILRPTPATAACEGPSLIDQLSQDDLVALAARVDAAPYPRGNRWVARRGDDVLHIVGTMHVNDARLDPAAERLRPIIDAADLILLETTLEDEARLREEMAADPSILFLTDGPTLPELMSEEGWRTLSAAARERQIPPFMAAKFKPWYLSMLLTVPPCAMDDMAAGQRGLDHRIMAIAAELGTPTQALEDGLTLLRAFGTEPLPEQIDLLEAGLAMNHDADAMFVTLIDSYFAEEHRLIWEVSRLNAQRMPGLSRAEIDRIFAEFETLLLADRNRAWISVILEAAARHDTVLLAFGAAHLSGEDGVLALLEAEGFTLSPAPF